MMRRFETVCYVAAGLCFLGGADAWLNVGAADWLIALCLTDPNAAMPDLPSVLMEDHHRGHAFLWLSAGAVLMLVATAHRSVLGLFKPRSTPLSHRRRLVATLLHVAKAAGPVRRSVIDEAFYNATGQKLGPNEARSAHRSCFRKGAPSLAALLRGVEHPRERRELVAGSTDVWLAVGIDSEAATRRLEEVMTLLELTEDQVADDLDARSSSISRTVVTTARRLSTRLGTLFQATG